MGMQKGINSNHPVKGSVIKVQPLTNLKDINTIKKLLIGKPRDLALFTIGINTNLRASDLCQIKVGMVSGLKPMESFEIKEKKTGKSRRITLNKSCIDAIQKLLKAKDLSDEDQLFKGLRGPIVPQTIHALVKAWCKAINLKGNFGSHTLRKTWGYHQRVQFKVGIPELMVCFNHSTQKQTLDYLCVQPEEIKNVYANEL